jgi:hypothetical protein
MAFERELHETAEVLCRKLREIENHPLYDQVWALSLAHGDIYKGGPTFEKELIDLERVLGLNRV